MSVQVMVTANGRMSLPVGIRKRLGLAGGGMVTVEETPEGVVLRTTTQIVAHAQALAKRYSALEGGSVDNFIACRAAETG